MSNHFKLSVVVIAALAITLASLYSCISRRLPNDRPPKLGPNDAEILLLDPTKHTITIQTPTGTKTEYAGRNDTIKIEKNGTVKVDRKLFGFEHTPFLGFGYGDGALRAQLGLSVAYAYRFDLNTQLSIRTDNGYRTIDPIISASYNFYSNTSVFAGTNPIALLTGLPAEYHVGIFVKF